MPKIRTDEIIEAVKRCVSGESSQAMEMQRLGVSSPTIRDWIRTYETFGADGFRSSKNEKYSKSVKENAVKVYLNSEGSQAEICKKFKIKDRKIYATGFSCIIVI